jgi:hypothetical protein
MGHVEVIATALLDRAGHDVVCVDDAFAHAETLGLVVVGVAR